MRYDKPIGFALVLLALGAQAVIPPPDKLLPDDTLVVLTAPDFPKLRDLYKKSAQGQLWDDPAMKPFRDAFLSKWQDEFVKPLERDLDIKFDNYTNLAQGQVTLAVTQNGWQGEPQQELGLLVLLDAKDKADQLKKNLAELRRKWVDSGKNLRTEKIRNLEFTILSMSSNDVPKTLKKFFPPSPEVRELGEDNSAKKAPAPSELVLGQVESLLILGNSVKPVEKVVTRLTGGAAPVLGDSAAYQANYQAMFRDAPLYAWANAKTFLEIWSRVAAQKKDNPQAPNPFDTFRPDKVIAATGLTGLKTVAFSLQDSAEGALLQVFLGAPESSRQGLFKILAGEPKETTPPSFVPADATKFQRWRIDGRKTWATLEKMLSDISPQWLGSVNFLLDTANAAAKEKDPTFDIRKNLIGNLGDDVISYEKPARGSSPEEMRSPPMLVLVGSPNADQLAAALRSILIFTTPQAANPAEREFLGRKIFSVPLGGLPLPVAEAAKPGAPRTLSYCASGGYLALSTDAATLEEFLRSSESQGKTLRETAGLTEATQKVTGPGTFLFGYENDVEAMRATFQAMRQSAGSATNGAPTGAAPGFLPGGVNIPGPQQSFKEWMDLSLLPTYDKVSKHFYFKVYGGSATVDGLSFKMFTPKPPPVKN